MFNKKKERIWNETHIDTQFIEGEEEEGLCVGN